MKVNLLQRMAKGRLRLAHDLRVGIARRSGIDLRDENEIVGISEQGIRRHMRLSRLRRRRPFYNRAVTALKPAIREPCGDAPRRSWRESTSQRGEIHVTQV